MTFLAFCGALLCGALLAFLLREAHSPLARLLCVVCAVLVTVRLLSTYSEVLEGTVSLLEDGGIGEVARVLLKTIGVALLCETVGDVCRDLGETACASRVELCGKLEVLALGLPLVSRLLSDLRELLP